MGRPLHFTLAIYYFRALIFEAEERRRGTFARMSEYDVIF